MKGAQKWEPDWDWEAHTHRRETGLIEHTCFHGIGHPSPGSILWMEEATGETSWGIHGCDGCCADPTFPSYKASLVIAHAIIRKQNEQLKELSEPFNSARRDSKPMDHTYNRQEPRRVTEMALSMSDEADQVGDE